MICFFAALQSLKALDNTRPLKNEHGFQDYSILRGIRLIVSQVLPQIEAVLPGFWCPGVPIHPSRENFKNFSPFLKLKANCLNITSMVGNYGKFYRKGKVV